MNLDQQLSDLRDRYDVIAEINLSVPDKNYDQWVDWLSQRLRSIHQPQYHPNQRVIFIHDRDYYVDNQTVGLLLKNVQVQLNDVDISNYFAIIVSTCPDIQCQMEALQGISTDSVPMTYHSVQGEFQKSTLERHPFSKKEEYQYGSSNPLKIDVDTMTQREKFLLTESKTFCIYPWIHIHAYPTGDAYPCCHAEMRPGKIGNCRTQTLEEIWNGEPMQRLRDDMLNEREHPACTRCYEQESAGFFSGRKSANKHHGHHIKKLEKNPFEMTYWDIRFSNLCNLRCRSCGHIFSSQWYQDQSRLAGPDWAKTHKPLVYAGRTETDMWEQLEPHLEYVEQIYFAGGEPLLMEEHYHILDELVRRKKFEVRLIYNTNFTHTDLKGRSVFEYWKQFHSVAVGASLDAQSARAEYIRKGTDWHTVEHNRREMLRICPEVDFYISPTLSIMNALHLTDFHRDWTEKGLLRAQDLNVNILQDPPFYRLDIAPAGYKQKIQQKFERHLEWLRPQDHLGRATQGFESAITFMNTTDNSHLIPQFWGRTQQLDSLRQENILDVIPELVELR